MIEINQLLVSPVQNKSPMALRSTKYREEKTYSNILKEKNEVIGKDKASKLFLIKKFIFSIFS